MKDENVINLRYSYSYSYSLMMAPASSSTVAVFHRRVGRYRLPMTRYLAHRAVRRRSSSTAVGHHPPSFIIRRRLWACGSFRRCPLPFPPNWTLPHLVAGIRRPAFQRWPARTALN